MQARYYSCHNHTIYIHIYTTHIYIYMHISTHIIYIYTFICTCTDIYICIHIYMHAYAFICTCTDIYIYICIHLNIILIQVLLFLCIHKYFHYVHKNIKTYIHVYIYVYIIVVCTRCTKAIERILIYLLRRFCCFALIVYYNFRCFLTEVIQLNSILSEFGIEI